MNKLVFKQPITDSAKLKFLEWLLKDNVTDGDDIYRDYLSKLNNGFYNIDACSDSWINKLKDLNIWEEPEIEIGTPCKFWDDERDRDIILYYGGLVKNATYKHLANSINGKYYSEYKNCEPITEIPKYRGKK